MKKSLFIILLVISFPATLFSQKHLVQHSRGKLWETLNSYGLIGSSGAWDYAEYTGIGFYPGFSGYEYPNNEEVANSPEKVTDANFHNFRSGPWIIVKDGLTLEAPDYKPKAKDYMMFHTSLNPNNWGIITNYRPFTASENFVGDPAFNSSLPEESFYTETPNVTGVTMKFRTYVWSYPGYSDFIIYDYVFKNTGDMVIPALNKIMKNEQALNEVWIVFHSAISVSTKGTLNFHYNSDFLSSAAPAGGFGGYGGYPGSDLYTVENEDAGDGKGLFYYSRDVNGGREPAPGDKWAKKSNWQELLKLKPEWLPELQDPACFGFAFLYRTPPPGASSDPFDADPTYFNVYNNSGEKFNGKSLTMNEGFGLDKFPESFFYKFATHNYQRENDGKMYAFTTSSFGPYKLAPGDSVRLIVAEVAGQLSMNDVVKGDPDHHFPDSSIAAINRNVAAVRNAVKWGFGANVKGISLAADVPDGPPAPNCSSLNASKGSDTAIIAVKWDKLAEESKILDGAGNNFFNGAEDISGYRIYRGQDKRSVWNLVADIPKIEFNNYWNDEEKQYEYLDKNVQFGFEFYYYVEAYYSNPKQWVSANNTVVNGLGELKSADVNRTPLTSAKPGPISISEKGWDVFVAPNPYIENDATHSFGEPTPRKIEFRNLPEKATIKIFNLSGELVKTIDHGPDEYGNLWGSIGWEQTSDSGLLVAPGLYIYVVESLAKDSQGQRSTGKLMIIR